MVFDRIYEPERGPKTEQIGMFENGLISSGIQTRWEHHSPVGNSPKPRSILEKFEGEFIEGEFHKGTLEIYEVNPMVPEVEELGPVLIQRGTFKRHGFEGEIFAWKIEGCRTNEREYSYSKIPIRYFNGTKKSGHWPGSLKWANGFGSNIDAFSKITSGLWKDGELQENTNQHPAEFFGEFSG